MNEALLTHRCVVYCVATSTYSYTVHTIVATLSSFLLFILFRMTRLCAADAPLPYALYTASFEMGDLYSRGMEEGGRRRELDNNDDSRDDSRGADMSFSLSSSSSSSPSSSPSSNGSSNGSSNAVCLVILATHTLHLLGRIASGSARVNHFPNTSSGNGWRSSNGGHGDSGCSGGMMRDGGGGKGSGGGSGDLSGGGGGGGGGEDGGGGKPTRLTLAAADCMLELSAALAVEATRDQNQDKEQEREEDEEGEEGEEEEEHRHTSVVATATDLLWANAGGLANLVRS